MIDVRGLSVTYNSAGGEVKAVEDLGFSLRKGDICAIIGPSGCGKTTLLYVLAGIITRYSGQALIGGAPASPKERRIGLIPQNYGLLEWATVYQNAVLGLDIKRTPISENKPYIERVLEKTGLFAIRHKYPGELSGGQRQRVSIARSFIMKPDVLLMDEPFSALDAMTREEMQDLFLEIWKENSVSTLFVTHSIEEAVYLGRSIAIMSPAPGHIVRIIDNPLFGRENLRMSQEYYRFAVELRETAKGAWSC